MKIKVQLKRIIYNKKLVDFLPKIKKKLVQKSILQINKIKLNRNRIN